MPKTDIKAMIKDLKKTELRELISVAQEVLSSLFNSVSYTHLTLPTIA